MSEYLLGLLGGFSIGVPVGMAGLFCWYWWTEVKRRRSHLRPGWKCEGRQT